MSIARVKEYFRSQQMEDRIIELDSSSATVDLAAQALAVDAARIAKTLSFHLGERIILVVAAGDTRVDNAKYKQRFGRRPRMLDHAEAEPLIGHAVGGVCPFAVNDGVEIYLDQALKRFTTVFPACGSSNSLIELSIAELVEHSHSKGWVDVCK